MIQDLNKGISHIRGSAFRYNHLNLPERVMMDNGDYVKYTYDAAGIKLKKEAKTGGSVVSTDYVAGKHYVNGTLSFLQHAEGRTLYDAGAFTYEYNITDHLGNVRVSVDQSGTVVQKDDYYPFGLTFNSWTNTSPKNLHLYNEGSEFNNLTKNYEAVFRRYDPALGRFNTIDALADFFWDWNPYQYAYNNPVFWNDPLGLMNEGDTTITSMDIVQDAWDRTPDGMNSSYVVNYNPFGGEEVDRQETENGVNIQYSGSYELVSTGSHSSGLSFSQGRVSSIQASILPTQFLSNVGNINTDIGFAITAADIYLGSKIAGIGSRASLGGLSGKPLTTFDRLGSIVKIGRFRVSSQFLTKFGGKVGAVGKFAGGLGIGISGLKYLNGDISGKEFAVDSFFAGVGIFGGPIGAGISLGYFGGKLAYEYFSGETLFEKPK